VPCGIFDDPARVEALKEDAATVRKAMVQINELGTATPLALNQSVRWITTKEEHAKSIITTASEYMLAQRVKKELFESETDYMQALVAHHTLIQAAMKTKQVVDVAACDVLDHAIADVGVMCAAANATRARPPAVPLLRCVRPPPPRPVHLRTACSRALAGTSRSRL
jgi:hypothetical protein